MGRDGDGTGAVGSGTARNVCARCKKTKGASKLMRLWRKRQHRGGGDDPLVFVMRNMFDGEVVTTVYHESDGDWQYITGFSPDPDPNDAQMVHQSHVYSTDPTLRELHSMPLGTWATREAKGDAWTFGQDHHH